MVASVRPATHFGNTAAGPARCQISGSLRWGPVARAAGRYAGPERGESQESADVMNDWPQGWYRDEPGSRRPAPPEGGRGGQGGSGGQGGWGPSQPAAPQSGRS